MKVTVRHVKNHLCTDNVVQIGYKQLFIVDDTKLYSYFTLVGRLIDGVWNLTTQKYSLTMMQQLNAFAREQGNAIRVKDIN